MITPAKLAQLAELARPTSDADWGSDRQINAENTFFSAVRCELTEEQTDEWDDYYLKATTNEMIDEALRLLAVQS